jgi:hypothetical protein
MRWGGCAFCFFAPGGAGRRAEGRVLPIVGNKKTVLKDELSEPFDFMIFFLGCLLISF